MFLRHWMETLVSFNLTPRSRKKFDARRRLHRLGRSIQSLEDRTLLSSVFIDGDDLRIEEFPGSSFDNLTLIIDNAFAPGQPHLRVSDPDNFVAPGPGTIADGNDVLVPLASFSGSILINTGDLDDRVTLDYTGGDFDRAVSYDGGGEISPLGDRLFLTGGTFTTTLYDFSDPVSDSIALLGGTEPQSITVQSLEGIEDILQIENREFLLPAVNNPDVVLGEGGIDEQILSGSQLTNTTFSEPTTGITIRGQAGTDDALTVIGVDLAGDLTIDLESGTDSITFDTTASSVGGHASLTTAMLDINVGLSGGSLDIVPNEAMLSVGIGENATGTLHLDSAELALLTGFTAIAIGDEAAAAGVTEIDTASFSTDVTVSGGSISVTKLNAGSNTVRLLARTGGVTDKADDEIDITAGTLRLESLTGGIGAAMDALSLSVLELSALAGGTGGLHLSNNQSLALEAFQSGVTSLETAGGEISLSTVGSLTVTSTIMAAGGDLTLTAEDGISVSSPAALSSPGGALALDADANQDGIGTANLAPIGAAGGDAVGSLTITAADIAFAGAIYGTGTLTLKPCLAGTTIGLGTGSTGDFHLDAADLTQLQNGFSSILIGDDAAGTGTVEISNVTFADPVSIVGGSIALGEMLTSDSDVDVTLTARTGSITTPAGTTSGNISSAGRTITFNGDIAPGGSPGQVGITGNLVLGSDDTVEIELQGDDPGTGYDQIVVDGDVTLDDALLDVSRLATFTPDYLQPFTIIDNQGSNPVTGTFLNLANDDTFSIDGYTFRINYDGGTGNDVVLTTLAESSPAISGTAGNDTFDVYRDGSELVVELNSIEVLRQLIEFTDSLTLNGLEGNDTFNLDYSGGLLDLPLSVHGDGHLSDATDYTISAGGTTLTSSQTDGDVLNILDGTSTASETYTVTGTSISRTNWGGSVSFDMLEQFVLNASETASSTIDVEAIAAGMTATINAGDAVDDINITTTAANSVLIVNAGGEGDLIDVATTNDTSLLFLAGEAGADTITVADTGSGTANGLQISGGSEADIIQIQNFAGTPLLVDGDAGDDQITLLAAMSDATPELRGGNGNDTFNVTSHTASIRIQGNAHLAATDTFSVTARSITATLTPETGDTLNILDGDASGSTVYTIAGSQVARTGGGTIDFAEIETLNLETSATAAGIVNVTAAAEVGIFAITTGTAADQVDITTTAANSVLIINTDAEADSIEVMTTGSNSLVFLNSGSGVDTITVVDTGAGMNSGMQISGGAGNDAIDVQNLQATTLLIEGNAGDDTITLGTLSPGTNPELHGGDDNDVFNVNEASVSIDIDGGTHSSATTDYTVTARGQTASLTLADGDRLNILESATATEETYTLNGETFTRTGWGTIAFTSLEQLVLETGTAVSADVDLDLVPAQLAVTVTTGSEDDDLDITALSTNTALTVNSGGGADTIDVADTSAASMVFLNGGTEADQITVLDTGSGMMSGLSISGEEGNDTIRIDNFDGHTLFVSGGDDGDSITVSQTAAGTHTELEGNDGDETFTLSRIFGNLDVNGGSNGTSTMAHQISARSETLQFDQTSGDQLMLLDSASTDSATYTLTGTTFTRDSWGPISYGQFEQIRLETSQTESSTINIDSLSAGMTAKVVAGNAADLITVANTATSTVLTIDAGAGDDELTVTTTAATSLLFLNGEAGEDTIDVAGTGSGTENGLQISGGADDDTISVQQFNGHVLQVTGDGGNDVITLTAAMATANPELNGGDGNDTFNVTAVTASIDISGGGHLAETNAVQITARGTAVTHNRTTGDVLHILDAGTAGADYTLSSDTVVRSGGGTIAYDDVEGLHLTTSSVDASTVGLSSASIASTLSITTGSAADEITITTTAADSVVTVNAGGGADMMEVVTTGDDSLLFVNGQDGADSIQVTETGAGLSSGVQISGGADGDTIEIQNLSARVLRVDGDGGNDAITLLGTAASTNPELDGGEGDDTFTLMAPTVDISLHGGSNSLLTTTETISARGVDASLDLLSGDQLSILDSGSATSETYTLAASTFTRTGWGTVTFATLEQIHLETSGTASSDVDLVTTPDSTTVVITTGSAADDIDVQTTGVGSVLTINSAGGGDTIDIATTGTNSLTFVNTAAGDDQITITGTGSGVSSGLKIDSGTEADTIAVASFDALVLNLSTGSGTDSITFFETSAGTNGEISGGADNDTVRLSNILGEIDLAGDANGTATESHSITARGSTATVSTTMGDQLLILDAASLSESTYGLTATTMTRTGWGTIAYQSFEQLTLETSSTAASTIDVSSLANGTSTQITAGSAADAITISNTGSDSVLTVDSGGGADEFLLTTSGSNALTILSGGTGNDTFEVLNTGSGASSGLSISGGEDGDTVLVQNVSAFVLAVNGNEGNDELTLNAAAAGTNPELWGDAGDDTINVFAPSVAIDLHGGPQTTAAGDSLNVSGGTYTDVTHTFLNETDGTIRYDTVRITYDGVEPVSDLVTTQNRHYRFNGAAETISLSDDSEASDGESLLDSTLGNAVTFSNPNASLSLDTTTGSGADAVTVSGLDAAFAANVSILGDNIAGQKDRVSLTGTPFSTGGGTLTINTGGDIAIEAGIVTLGGDVTLRSESAIRSEAAGSISTTGGMPGEASGGVDIFADRTILFDGVISTIGAGVGSDGGHVFIRNLGPGATGGEIAVADIAAAAGIGGIAGRVSVRTFASGSPLTLNGLISTSTGGVVRLFSEGAVVDGSGDAATDIIAGTVSAQARTAIGAGSFLDLAAPPSDTATTVAASTGNGVINLRHAGNMTVGSIGSADSIPALTGLRSYFSNPAAFTLAAAGELRIDDVVEHDYGGAILLSGDSVVIDADVTTPGAGSISVDATTSATITSSGRLSTVHGALTLIANSSATAAGESTGVLIDGGSVSSLNGAMTIAGTGGDSGSSHGIVLRNGANVESLNLAAITLTGVGNASGSGIVIDGSTLTGPVDSIALLATQGTSFTGGANLTLRLAGPNSAAEFEPVIVNGTLSLSGNTLTLDDSQFTPTGESSHLLIDNAGADAIAGTFAGLPEGTVVLVGGEEFTITYVGGDGNDVELIPVPDTPPTPELTSSIIGFNNGNWWVSTAGSDGEYTTTHWARWPTTSLRQVLYGDFNGDGLEDIAGWLPNGDWRVGLAQADKSFTYELWTTWRTDDVKEVHVGDFDNDGRDDLVGLFKSTGSDQGNWWVARSTGSSFVSAGRWATLADYFAIESVQVGNFDGVDGTDLAILTSTGDWRLALSTNDRFLSSKWATWNLSSGVDQVMVGDFDGNGRSDVIGLIGSGDFRDWTVGLSTGTGFVTENWGRWKFSTGLQAAVVGDFNGDTKTDIAALMGSGVWWTGLAETGRFQAVSAGRWSFTPIAGSVLVGDTNGDGLSDILGRASTGYWWSAESNGSALENRSVVRWSSTVDWKYEDAAPRAYAPDPLPAASAALDQTPSVTLKRWTDTPQSPHPEVQPADPTPIPLLLTPSEFTVEDDRFFSEDLFALLDQA